METNWIVTYSGGFWAPHGSVGTPIAIEKHLTWGENHFYVPAAYLSEEGLVLDICAEIEREDIRAFLDKWYSHLTQPLELPHNLREQIEQENPMAKDYYANVSVNGQPLSRDRACGIGWVPPELLPDEKINDHAEVVLRHYGLNPAQGWSFRRVSLKWTVEKPPKIDSLTLTLSQRPRSIPGKPFEMPAIGESVEIIHPLRRETYTLTVREVSREQVSDRLARPGLPEHALFMSCTLSPDLDCEHFQIRDTVEDERSKQQEQAASIGIIGGADGPTAIAFLTPQQPHLHCAVSSMRYAPPKTVVWQPVFREKTAEDLTVELI